MFWCQINTPFECCIILITKSPHIKHIDWYIETCYQIRDKAKASFKHWWIIWLIGCWWVPQSQPHGSLLVTLRLSSYKKFHPSSFVINSGSFIMFSVLSKWTKGFVSDFFYFLKKPANGVYKCSRETLQQLLLSLFQNNFFSCFSQWRKIHARKNENGKKNPLVVGEQESEWATARI